MPLISELEGRGGSEKDGLDGIARCNHIIMLCWLSAYSENSP